MTFVLVAALFVSVAGVAHAAGTVFDVSSKNRFWCCTNTSFGGFFVLGAPAPMSGYISMGTPMHGGGIATQGAGPTASIHVPKGQVAKFASMFQSTIPARKDIFTDFGTFSVSNGSGTLKKGGGNAAQFSFCPGVKPGPGACTRPTKAIPSYASGRVNVKPGPHHFGGTLGLLAGPGGKSGSEFFVGIYIGGSPPTHSPALTANIKLPMKPLGMSPQFISKPAAPANLKTGPMAMGMTIATFHAQYLGVSGAGPWTTGTVTVQVTGQKAPLIVQSVVLKGSDNRTPAGKGNIQVVSGEIINDYKGPSAGTTQVLGDTIHLQFIPEPSVNLAFAGGAVGLLLVGLLNARRRES